MMCNAVAAVNSLWIKRWVLWQEKQEAEEEEVNENWENEKEDEK